MTKPIQGYIMGFLIRDTTPIRRWQKRSRGTRNGFVQQEASYWKLLKSVSAY